MLGKCVRCGRTVAHSKAGNPFRHKTETTKVWWQEDPPVLGCCNCGGYVQGIHHPQCPDYHVPTFQVSDPATTLEVTTTRGDDVNGKGPWFSAKYASECAGCCGAICEGDTIRANGQGGYECEDCAEEVEVRQERAADWQAQASAAARRHVAAQSAPLVELRIPVTS